MSEGILKISEDVFRKIEFIDFDKGLECCADSFELYLRAVYGYVYTDSKLEVLTDYFKDENWADYRVCIHGVKSSSLLIGMDGISMKAKALEMAAAERNLDYVFTHHEGFMEEYREVTCVLKAILDEYGVNE